MAACVFSGGASVSMTDGSALDLTADGKYSVSFQPGTLEEEYDFVTSAGLDGCGSKDMGMRSRNIVIEIIYVAATENAAYLAAQTDGDNLAIGGASSLTAAGQTYPACFLAASKGGKWEIGQPKSTGYGKFWVGVSGLVQQKRLA